MTQTRRHFIAALGAASATAPALLSGAAQAGTGKTQVYAEDGIAVDGTDVVAYFTQGAPVPGSAEFSHDWNGATWRFASAENRAAFAADPEAYAPQYGGYCAYAVSEGYTASTDPKAWRIEDGKLYLNYSRRVQRIWEKDIPGRIDTANANWPEVLK